MVWWTKHKTSNFPIPTSSASSFVTFIYKMKLIILTQQGRNYIRSPMWMGRQVSVVVRALATAGDRNPTPKVIYWPSRMKKKCSAGALGMSRGKNSTEVARSPAPSISWLCCHLGWFCPQVGSFLEGTKWRLAVPHSELYRAPSP